MPRLLTEKNGRLRTGLVAILLFSILIASAGFLFELKKPMESAMVAVKHVFEPQIDEAKKAIPEPVKRVVKKVVKAVAESKAVTEKKELVPPVKIAGKKADAPNSGGELPKKPIQELARNAEKETSKKPGAKPVKPEDSDQTRPRETVKAKPLVAKKPEDAVQTDPPDSPEIQLDVSDQLKRVIAWGEPEKDDPKVDLTAGMNRLLKKETDTKRSAVQLNAKPLDDAIKKKMDDQPKEISIAKDPLLPKRPIVSKSPDHLGSNREERSITLPSKEYLRLFRKWRTVGAGSENGGKVPLRVENLRSAYALFQMKPVAIVGKRLHYDLTDRTRIPEASLAEYSTTVFHVDDPWDKWGDSLSESGIRESDTLEVRYYMYDFVKNAIYTRAHQAAAWSKETGRIKADTKLSEIDVLGRVFVIKQQGGGRFGVFVPIALDIAGGQTIPIDPACFAGQPDVRALQTAGLL